MNTAAASTEPSSILPPGWWRLATHAQSELIKTNPVRQVHKVTVDDHSLYIKIQRLRWIDIWTRRSAGHRETAASTYAFAHDIPAIHVLAHQRFQDNQGRWEATVSLEIKGATSLPVALDNATSRTDRNRLGASLARLMATAHAANFLHGDPHAGNFLLRPASAGTDVECVFVDLPQARCGQTVTENDAASNLAALAVYLADRTSRTERLRWLNTYFSARQQWTGRDAHRRFISRLIRATQRRRFNLYRTRDRRIGRTNAYFSRSRTHLRLVITTRRIRDCVTRLGFELPPTNDEPPDQDAINHASEPLTFVARWGRSPAWNHYRSAMLLMHRDLPVAAGWWWMRIHHGPDRGRESWQPLTLEHAVRFDRAMANAVAAQRRQLLESAGRLLARTTARGVVINNLKLDGISIASTAGANLARTNPVLFWNEIDASATRKPLPLPACRWMLARRCHWPVEGWSRCDHARLLRSFCRSRFGHGADGNWRKWWRWLQSEVQK